MYEMLLRHYKNPILIKEALVNDMKQRDRSKDQKLLSSIQPREFTKNELRAIREALK